MPRFTISQHEGRPEGAHYDVFLEKEAGLKTWRIAKPAFDPPQAAVQIEDHRPKYLDFEGAISGDRGRVKIWETGTYTADVWEEGRVVVAVRGRQLRTRLRLDRVKAPNKDKPGEWTVADAGAPIRKLAAAMLRQPSLDAPPSKEFESTLQALSGEEGTLMSQVQAFTTGEAVQWDRVSTSAEIRQRLQADHARWRHPWIQAAMAQAERLDEIVRALRTSAP